MQNKTKEGHLSKLSLVVVVTGSTLFLEALIFQ